MRKLTVFALFVSLFFLTSSFIQAQGMMGQFNGITSTDSAAISSTAQDEANGKEINDKLQAKQTACQNLTDDDFDVLGDYFMGQRIGNTASHASMNEMMTRMMGNEGEKQMHISLGKRFSGCDPGKGGGNNMMGYGNWGGFGGFGYIPMILFWGFIIWMVFMLFKSMNTSGINVQNSTPLEILKSRYAKGEIDKKEFESMKKDLA